MSGLSNLTNVAATALGGPAAGAALSVSQGLLQTIQANKLKKKAESNMPEAVDPNQAAFLAEIQQKKNSISTGADVAEGIRAADAGAANANQAIIEAGGGDTASVIQGLLASNKMASQAKNQALAVGQNKQMGYDNMYMGMLNKISARKLQLEMYRSQQARAEYARKKTAASQNLATGAAGLLSLVKQPQAQMPMGTDTFDASQSVLGDPTLNPDNGDLMNFQEPTEALV